MRLVVLETPFAAPTAAGIDANVDFARACVRDCLARGDAPIASHLLFTQPGILRDGVAEERALGMRAGLAWVRVADATVVYTNRGVSRGMKSGIEHAEAHGKPIERRVLTTDLLEAQLAKSVAIEDSRRALAERIVEHMTMRAGAITAPDSPQKRADMRAVVVDEIAKMIAL